MKFYIDYSKLLRNDNDNLFKWSKYGIIVIHNKLNLNKLSYYEALDFLDIIESNTELTFQKKQDIKEVREFLLEIKDELDNNISLSEFDF